MLAEKIRQLKDRTLKSLDSGHDYFVHTKDAWRIVLKWIEQDASISLHNQATQSNVTGAEFAELIPVYVEKYVTAATLQQFLSEFEYFVMELIRLWLTTYPHGLRKNQVEFSTVLDCPDRDAIIALIVQRKVQELAYQRIGDWFAYLNQLVNAAGPSQDDIERLAEIKATRDALVHNNGVANRTYLQKSGAKARFVEGEPIELPETYHRESWNLIRSVIENIANSCISKA